MKRVLLEGALLAVIFLAFVVIHEAGHYVAAAYFDLQPGIVIGEPTMNNIMGGVVGVEHRTGSPFERQTVILSALVLPFGVGGAMRLTKSEVLQLAGTVFLILALAALIPFPRSDFANLLSLVG